MTQNSTKSRALAESNNDITQDLKNYSNEPFESLDCELFESSDADNEHATKLSNEFTRAEFVRLYFKNKDGSERDGVGVYEIGVGSPARFRNKTEELTVCLTRRENEKFLQDIDISFFDEGIGVYHDGVGTIITIEQIINFCKHGTL